MSNQISNPSVAPSAHNSAATFDINSEVEGFVSAVQFASNPVDVGAAANHSASDQLATVMPPATGMGFGNSFHPAADVVPVDNAQAHISGWSGFADVPGTIHGIVFESHYQISDDALGNNDLSDIFDDVSVGFGNPAVDAVFNSPSGVPIEPRETYPIGLPDVFSDAQGGTHGGGGGGSHGGGGGGGHGGGGGGGSTGLSIHVSFDASVSSAPSGFTDVVNQVVQYFESHFSDPITVNLNVGYGEVDNYSLGGALGSSVTNLAGVSYASLLNALNSDAAGSFDQSAVASLSSTNPTGGQMVVSTAEAKALGYNVIGGGSVDGYIGFSNLPGIFDYNNGDGVGTNQYDFFGVVAHEISEVMGRILLVGWNGYYMPYDLFHYSSNGVADFSGNGGYFSIDGGQTILNTFNNSSNGGDAGDWAGATIDAFNAFGAPGVVLQISNVDLQALDVIGWNSTNTTTYTASSSSLTMAQLETQTPVAWA